MVGFFKYIKNKYNDFIFWKKIKSFAKKADKNMKIVINILDDKGEIKK